MNVGERELSLGTGWASSASTAADNNTQNQWTLITALSYTTTSDAVEHRSKRGAPPFSSLDFLGKGMRNVASFDQAFPGLSSLKGGYGAVKVRSERGRICVAIDSPP